MDKIILEKEHVEWVQDASMILSVRLYVHLVIDYQMKSGGQAVCIKPEK